MSGLPVEKQLKHAVLVSSAVASFLTPFMGSALNVALPLIAKEFSLTAVSIGWVASSYIISAALLLLIFGRLADVHGRKMLFLGGLAVYTFTTCLCALAPSAGSLIAFRVLQGAGGAMIFGTGMAILTSVYPPEERGKALGITTAAVYLGLSLGPVAGGYLAQNWGWRSIFWTNVPLSLAGFLIVLIGVKSEWTEASGERFIPDLGPLIRNRTFLYSNLAAFINYCANAAVGFLLSLYLQYAKGLTPRLAGFMLIIQPLMMAAFSPLAGRMSDRIEPRFLASAGMTASGGGLLLLVFLDSSTSFRFLALCLVLLGAGFGLFSSPNTNAAMSSVDRRFYGVAAALLGTMRLTGQMFSLGVVMMIFAAFMGHTPISAANLPDFLLSSRSAFIAFAILCFVGILPSMARGNRR